MTTIYALALITTQLCYDASADTHAIKFEEFFEGATELQVARQEEKDLCIDLKSHQLVSAKRLLATDERVFSIVESNK